MSRASYDATVVIGEMLAELALEGATTHVIVAFSSARFAAAEEAGAAYTAAAAA